MRRALFWPDCVRKLRRDDWIPREWNLALSGIAGAVERQLRQSLTYSLRPVINATGVILHTNLGAGPIGERLRWNIFARLLPDIRILSLIWKLANAASGMFMWTGCFGKLLTVGGELRSRHEQIHKLRRLS